TGRRNEETDLSTNDPGGPVIRDGGSFGSQLTPEFTRQEGERDAGAESFPWSTGQLSTRRYVGAGGPEERPKTEAGGGCDSGHPYVQPVLPVVPMVNPAVPGPLHVDSEHPGHGEPTLADIERRTDPDRLPVDQRTRQRAAVGDHLFVVPDRQRRGDVAGPPEPHGPHHPATGEAPACVRPPRPRRPP